MAVFRPDETKRVCELNFDDAFFYELPLTEKMAESLAEICERNKIAIEKISGSDPKAFSKAYDMCLDMIDEVLGAGAADDIMSIYEEPGLLQVAKVINYISSEYETAYNAAWDQIKAIGEIPNRAERRAAQRTRRSNR